MFEFQKEEVRVGKRVGTKHVNEVIRNYKKERWSQNSQRLGKEDSLSVWYGLEELENFMRTCRAHGADGIRLYFAVYGKEQAPEPLYEGRQTVVLVATKDKETSEGTITKDVYLTSEKGPDILAFNIGRLCPPFCTTGNDAIGIVIVDKGKEGMIVT